MHKVELWFRSALKPDPILTVSEWADEHRMLSKKSSSEAGRWRTERTPYLKEIMDALSVMSPVRKVVLMKGAQVGGTECGNNWLGYIIDHAPGPVMFVLPRIEDAKRNSKLRIDPLIEETPKLSAKIGSAKSRDSDNTILQKGFEGGELVMTGANSAAGLRSMPARYLFLDEVDAYPLDVEGEGDPISLALARSRTFARRKAFLCSTPTIDGYSKIHQEFELSDKRFFNIPCPHCTKKQVLKFDNLKWEKNKPETALYYCEHCGEAIEERFKTRMLNAGEWVPTAESDTHGFHISALYSPLGWFSWADIAKDYEDAKRELEVEKKHDKMRVFVNTILGETYKEPGEAPEWQRIYLRREPYKIGTVHERVAFLTCGVDVQKDRLEMEVVGWGRGLESWSVEYEVLSGDTSQEKVWDDLANYLQKIFHTSDGRGLPIHLTAIDSGFNTQQVYNFCRRFSTRRVVPVKGFEELATMYAPPRAVDVKMSNGRTYRRGVKYWPVGVSVIKSEIYGLLKIDPPVAGAPIPKGLCHFPEYDEEFFRQLCAEKVSIKKNRKGFTVMEWVKDRERNEALDVRVYNRAAAAIIGVDRFTEREWARMSTPPIVKTSEVVENVNTETKNQPPPSPKRRRDRRPSDYW